MWKLMVVCLCINPPMTKPIFTPLVISTHSTYEDCYVAQQAKFKNPGELDLRGLACVKEKK